jgi:hypothetical protein
VLADLTTSYDWAGLIASMVTILLFVGAILAFIGRLFWRKVDQKLTEIDHKSTPNGKDTLSLGDTAARTESKVDELRGMFIMHLQNHPGASTGVAVVEKIAVEPTRAEVEIANGNPPQR